MEGRITAPLPYTTGLLLSYTSLLALAAPSAMWGRQAGRLAGRVTKLFNTRSDANTTTDKCQQEIWQKSGGNLEPTGLCFH